MKLDLALQQISEIHGHLDRSEVYRGYRSLPVGLTGVCALVAAALQARFFQPTTPLEFVWFWVGVAVVCGGIGAWGVLYHVLYRGDSVARRRTSRVVGQFLPSLAAGFVVTLGLTQGTGDHIALLPGLWAITFGLGAFASRPYLPRVIGWVALYYVGAGAVLLQIGGGGGIPSPAGMAVTFGIGQIATALILYWNIERLDYDEEALV